MAKLSGKNELLCILHFLHFTRVISAISRIPKSDETYIKTMTHQLEDAYIYIIQLLLKFSDKELSSKNVSTNRINSFVVQTLTKVVLHINAKYEALFNFTLFKNIKVFGERDQFAKIDLRDTENDEYLNNFFIYGARIDSGVHFSKNKLRTKDDFIAYFEKQYSPYKDLFKLKFKISLKKFMVFVDFLLHTVINQIKKASPSFDYLDNGQVNIQSVKTILKFAESLKIEQTAIYKAFGKGIKTTIEKLTFNPTSFEEKELKFNIISRTPIIKLDNFLLISPELILDSLLINSHYSLLESDGMAEEYKKRYANDFINRISKIAGKYGYTEIQRELDLFERKNKIGDLDIILKKEEKYLIIEAKSHSLPLNVYFHDFIATEQRLKYQQKEWEKKVMKRKSHIENNTKFKYIKDFNYIIISKNPEIISHYSDLLVLSIDEFEHWLEKGEFETFQEVLDSYYNFEEPNLTPEQLDKINQELMTPWSFHEE